MPTYFKVLTHDFRPPLQGGEPIWDGRTLPFDLPTVRLDTGPEECAEGWNFCADLASAFRIAGLWPTGRPSVPFVVAPAADVITRGDKLRASSLSLIRLATPDEIADGVLALSRPFGIHQDAMARETLAWRDALARPLHDPAEVEAQLAVALSARDLSWSLEQFESGTVAWDANVAHAFSTTRRPLTRRPLEGLTQQIIKTLCHDFAHIRYGPHLDWDARADWDTWDARAALMTYYVRLMGWQQGEPDQYTIGIREAYLKGLEVSIPTGPNMLGWAMAEP